MAGHFHGSIDSASGIDHLLSFESESVSEVWRRGFCEVREVPVSQETVSDVTDIQLGIDFGIFCVFCGFDAFFGGFLRRTEHGHCPVFVFNPCEYVCQCKP